MSFEMMELLSAINSVGITVVVLPMSMSWFAGSKSVWSPSRTGGLPPTRPTPRWPRNLWHPGGQLPHELDFSH